MNIIFCYNSDGIILWDKVKTIPNHKEFDQYTTQNSETKTPILVNCSFPIFKNSAWKEGYDQKDLFSENQYTMYAHISEDGCLIGFYSTEHHKDIPQSAISISKEVWKFLLENQGEYKFDLDKISPIKEKHDERIASIDNLISEIKSIIEDAKSNRELEEQKLRALEETIKNMSLLNFSTDEDTFIEAQEKQNLLTIERTSLLEKITELKTEISYGNYILSIIKYPTLVDSLNYLEKPQYHDDLMKSKLQEINVSCQSAIYAGVDIETAEGTKHFSLTSEDQLNITGLITSLEKALLGQPSTIDPVKGVPYHADGELCKFWSATDFINLATTATNHVFYHQTYCNHLRTYIKRLEDYDELSKVFYGMELPPDLQTSMMALLGV